MKTILLLLACFGYIIPLIAVPGGPGATPPAYAIIDLGTLGGNSSVASGINASGQVTGYASVSGGAYHAFLYNNGSMHDIGTFTGGSSSYALGINDSGKIVGYATTSTAATHAFLYSGGPLQDLATLPGDTTSEAYGINENGEVVGQSGDRPFLLNSGGSMEYIGTLGGDGASRATAINATGQIVGISSTSNNTESPAFLYSGGAMQNLGTLGGANSMAQGINSSALVVGLSYLNGGSTYHAFYYDSKIMNDLGTLGGTSSVATGINNNGLIVGADSASGHAFLYRVGVGMYDLNSPLFAASTWTLQYATAINDSGQIVGYGINPAGQTHAFLLNPIPAGSMEAIEVQPTIKVYGIPPARNPGKDSLVVITHGWVPIEKSFYSSASITQTWVDTMANSISALLSTSGPPDWEVYGYHWELNAWTYLPGIALNNANQEGINLGNAIANEKWAHVHFIAHSAGAELIESATRIVKQYSPGTTVQCTFLDPYLGYYSSGVAAYGLGADWSDRYAAHGDIENAVVTFTDTPLEYAYNVDVTDLDPGLTDYRRFSSPIFGQWDCTLSQSSHGWAIKYYQNTITGNINNYYAGLGFPLSLEGGNWNYALQHYQVGNAFPVSLGLAPPGCASSLPVIPPVQVSAVNPSMLQSVSQSTTGTLLATSGGGLTAESGSPAWITYIAPYTNAVNVIDFDANYTSSAGAAGLLTLYWDTNIIGSVDEKTVGQGTHHYSFPFSLATSFTTHVFGVRLDPFTNVQSIVTITNIVLSEVGVNQPFLLTATRNSTNGSLLFQLNGEAGFDYGLQVSTDLINWTQIAILENTNGTVIFYDPDATNYTTCRFYRAVAPY